MITTILTSTVIAAIVSNVVVLLTSERRLAAENVIQERMKWRDKVRELASCVHKELVRAEADTAKLQGLRAKLTLHLNPHDENDQQILQLIAPIGLGRADEFTQRVALLLKHDWERSKQEASLFCRITERPPARVRFENFTPGDGQEYRRCRFCLCAARR